MQSKNQRGDLEQRASTHERHSKFFKRVAIVGALTSSLFSFTGCETGNQIEAWQIPGRLVGGIIGDAIKGGVNGYNSGNNNQTTTAVYQNQPSNYSSPQAQPSQQNFSTSRILYACNSAEDLNGNGYIELNAQELKGLRNGQVISFSADENVTFLINWEGYPFRLFDDINLNDFEASLDLRNGLNPMSQPVSGNGNSSSIQKFEFPAGSFSPGKYSLGLFITNSRGAKTGISSSLIGIPEVIITPPAPRLKAAPLLAK